MEDTLYSKFLGYVDRESFYGDKKITVLARGLNEFFSNGVSFLYPKGLFIDNDNVQLFVFNNDDLTIIKSVDSGITLTTYKYKNIKLLELFKGHDERDIGVDITFENKERLTLRSILDTNEHWARSFAEEIRNIYFLINK